MNPYIIINFKTYPASSGKNSLRLSRCLEKVANSSKKVMLAVQNSEIFHLSSNISLPVLAQHVDFFSPGRNTGFIIPETVKKDGAFGSLLNHSEHPLSFDVLKKTILRCKDVGLKSVVCIPNMSFIDDLISLGPDFIAYEEPSLISSGKSITSVMPDAIFDFSSKLKGTGIIPLVGAGVSSSEDVKKALEFGTKGVLVSSAVVNSKSPSRVLSSFMK